MHAGVLLPTPYHGSSSGLDSGCCTCTLRPGRLVNVNGLELKWLRSGRRRPDRTGSTVRPLAGHGRTVTVLRGAPGFERRRRRRPRQTKRRSSANCERRRNSSGDRTVCAYAGRRLRRRRLRRTRATVTNPHRSVAPGLETLAALVGSSEDHDEAGPQDMMGRLDLARTGERMNIASARLRPGQASLRLFQALAFLPARLATAGFLARYSPPRPAP